MSEPSTAVALSTSPAKKPAPPGGVKETIESILIAFILAFVFRAYVVEAFVIPTGSMAPTLLGAHTRQLCPDCGYAFTVNVSSPTSRDGTDIAIPSDTFNVAQPDIYCPNCGFQVSRQRLDGDTRQPPQPVHYGDRLLVMKYLYLLRDPARWDVVVFKSPSDPKHYDYGINYIKRLVGLPGESIMVLDGDLYTRRGDSTPWQIQTKTWDAQQALWRLVYDNDYVPMGLERGFTPWRQPWTPEAGGSGWTTGANGGSSKGSLRTFKFDNASGTGTLGFDATVNPSAQTLNEFLVYDTSFDYFRKPSAGFNTRNETTLNPVSDIMIRCFYQRKGGDGPFRLELGKGADLFTAEIAPGKIRLLVSRAGRPEEELATQAFSSSDHRPVQLEFMNVDHRVSLRVDGPERLASTPAQYAPNVDQLIEDFNARKDQPDGLVKISAAGQTCDVSHLSLWRDVYYTNSIHSVGGDDGKRWAMPDRPITLGDGEYFVMGDNSSNSSDARYWREPIDLPAENLNVQAGRVPARFLLGKAFFVYWPAGFRPFDTNMPSIVPNFGQMRFIH